MTTVTILPIETAGGTTYQAVASGRIAEGTTAGQALDALAAQFPDVGSEPFLIVKRLGADAFFSSAEQTRLRTLIDRWREVRDHGGQWSTSEQAELESLIDVELVASGRRAEAIAKETGK
jgi:hypothetical protein